MNHKHYTLNQAAQRLGISVTTLRRLVNSGEIDCYRPTSRILFTEIQLTQFENRKTVKAKVEESETL